MIDVNKLWKTRFQLYVKETRRYLKLIFNDHFKFVLIFAIGGGAYYYQSWLKTMPQTFPIEIILALIIGFVLTGSSILTFLKEADIVFLLPIETQLKSYFNRSLALSFLFHFYILVFTVAALGPLYFHKEGTSISEYLILMLIFVILKGINIMVRWYIQFFPDMKTGRFDKLIRFTLNVSLVYLLVSGASWIFPAAIGTLFIALLVYFLFATKGKGLKWECLIELEAQRMMTFYRIANMFTDVPKYKERVKKRHYLDWIANRLPFEQSATFSYLYYRTFIRSSDYFGIYVRLLVIGAILLYFLPLVISKLAVLMLFIYLSGFQLLTLARHHSTKIWMDLYPISAEIRRSNFLKMLFELLVVKCFLLAFVILVTGDFLLAFLAIGIGLLFTYYFVFSYVKNKLAITKDE
ncbi:ABC transporter permease [Calidifontibacillus oryziterrae]|uniref:ABC transporter permease n=1 Tax=Calidifontibacillus oryziterrae TaxID=1191699 RepID=UPI0002F48897|nr:ABC transporter permease [Calidifontibacillus oryziterrae]